MQDSKTIVKNLNCMRGLFAIEVVLGHVGRYETGILHIFGKFMICSVAFFYFVSAYSMSLSVRYNPNYLKNRFLFRKVGYLFSISVFMYLLRIIIQSILNNQLGYAIPSITFSGFIRDTNWFIWAICFFYVLFWICYSFMYKYRIMIITAITIVLISLLYFAGVEECWVASSMGFVLGVFYGEYNAILDYNHSKKGIATIVVMAIFGLSALGIKNESYLSMVIMRNAMCISTIMIAVLVSRFSFVRENIFTKILTKYSMELYLSQFIWLDYMYLVSSNIWIRAIFVVTMTTLTAAILVYPMKLFIRKMISKCL